MSENGNALISTLEGAAAILVGVVLDSGWAKGAAFAAAFFFAMCAIRQLLLAYKDGSNRIEGHARK